MGVVVKRVALRRSAPLARTSRLRPRSRKTAAVYVKRRKFVAAFLRGRECEAKALGGCYGVMTVHESISRAQLGSILPDAKAKAQGQTFHALCVGHHSWITDHPAWSRANGFRQ